MNANGHGPAGARVAVVIPVLNAMPWLPDLERALAGQQPRPPDEIVLVDSGSTDDTPEWARAHGMSVERIDRFSHGGARNLGVRAARADIVVLMTQDALPRDAHWLSALLEPLADKRVAAACSRQIPRPNATPMERFFLAEYFPEGDEPLLRKRDPSSALRHRDIRFSNVSAAIRREVALKIPFDESLIMSEDQQFVRDALEAGWSIAYCPKSVVIHSHRYTLAQTFRRYFDSVLAFRQLFRDHTVGVSAGLGIRYTAREMLYLIRRAPHWIPYYLLYTAAKAGGTLAAHAADRLPLSWRRRLSLNPAFWSEG